VKYALLNILQHQINDWLNIGMLRDPLDITKELKQAYQEIYVHNYREKVN
jgi:hypothetical protein